MKSTVATSVMAASASAAGAARARRHSASAPLLDRLTLEKRNVPSAKPSSSWTARSRSTKSSIRGLRSCAVSESATKVSDRTMETSDITLVATTERIARAPSGSIRTPRSDSTRPKIASGRTCRTTAAAPPATPQASGTTQKPEKARTSGAGSRRIVQAKGRKIIGSSRSRARGGARRDRERSGRRGSTRPRRPRALA